MDKDFIFEITLSIVFLYSIFNVKKQYKKYQQIKNTNNLNKYKEIKILIWEISTIFIGIVYIIMLIIGWE